MNPRLRFAVICCGALASSRHLPNVIASPKTASQVCCDASQTVLVGTVRVGDVVAAISAGENFTQTGRQVRERSPFAHTLVCGDTNGMFGYIGDDAEIDRGGYETESFWMVMYNDGFRLRPAKGTIGRILRGFDEVFHGLTQPRNAQA